MSLIPNVARVRPSSLPILLAVGLLLAGCGGSSQAAGKAPAAAAPEPPAREEIAAPAPKEAAVVAPAPAKPAPKVAQQPPAPAKPAPRPAPKPAPEKTAAPAAFTGPLMTLAEVASRRDLWPAKVALKKPLALSPAERFPIGKELPLANVVGGNAHLDTGNGLVEVPVPNTDLIERASATKASLTPEQLALNAQTLPSRPELWPLKVALTTDLQFGNGVKIQSGREVSLRYFENGLVSVYDRQAKNFFQAEINETDVVTRARERLKLAEGEREPFFIRSLAASLEPAPAGGTDPNLDKVDLVLVYRARLGCTRCAAFLPELEKFYARMRAEHPRLEVVFYSDDFTAEDMQALLAREKLPGRVIGYDKRLEAGELANQTGQLLPLVFVYDRTGKLLTRNHPNNGAPTAVDVLADVEKRLKEKP